MGSTTRRRRSIPGAPSLAATPAVADLPDAADRVDGGQSQRATRQVPTRRSSGTSATFAIDAERTIRYAAGIPQRANTATWPGATPTPASLQQTANLNNNTGPSTREGATEQSLTNRVRVEGDYTGDVIPGGNTHITATDTRPSPQKTCRCRSPSRRAASSKAGVARYTFTIQHQ